MTASVPVGQALAQAREIEALRADVQALAEALEQAARGRHDWHDKDIVYPQAFEICTAGACERARAALSRDGVRRGRGEETR